METASGESHGIPFNLYTLQPIEDSLAWFKMQRSMNSQLMADQLGQSADLFRKILSNFDRPVKLHNLVSAAGIAADLGDLKLFTLLKARNYFQIPPMDSGDPVASTQLSQAEIELSRNKAVLLREEGLALRREGKLEEAEKVLEKAGEFFDIFKFKSRASEPLEITERKLDELTQTFEYADAAEAYSDPKAVEAQERLGDIVDEIVEGKTNIPGVDSRWISVAYNVHPPREDYPQAYQEFGKLVDIVAQEYGTSKEEMDEYAASMLKELFTKTKG